MKVGDTFYYRKPTGGRLYLQAVILRETSRSWIVARFEDAKLFGELEWFINQCTKLPKSGKGWVLGTKHDADLALWALAERPRICVSIAGQTPKTLLEIAKLIGYQKLPQEEV